MRNHHWRRTLVTLSIMLLAVVATGCKSGGWGMSSPSWMSWNKKKPPTSSIAGTRDPIQPPSITVPPYPASGTTGQSALASNASSSPASGTGVAPTAYDFSAKSAPSSPGYATGPYSTGGGAMPTQQGFYSTSQDSGPSAYTADSRGGSYPGSRDFGGVSPMGAGSSGANHATPPAYGPTPDSYSGAGYGMNQPTASTPFAPAQYPATSGWPSPVAAAPGAGSFPVPSQPAAFQPGSNLPYGTAGSPGNPNAWGAPGSGVPMEDGSYESMPYGYADGTPAYDAAAPIYGSFQPSGTGSPMGAYPSTQAPSSPYPSTGYPMTTDGYRPGSTARSRDFLPPAGTSPPTNFGGSSSTPYAPPGGTYYPTYTR